MKIFPGRICALSMLSALAFACADAATVYLKADASGDSSGTSWSNACTTYADALARLREVPFGEPASLLIARGIYTTPSSASLSGADPTVISNQSFTVSGGYRAESDDDLVRDPEVYQTILTGLSVKNLKAATWTQINPVPGEFRRTLTAKVLPAIDAEERLQFPEFTDAHDTFYLSNSGSYIPMLIYGNGASGTIDGLKFVGFHRGGNRNGIIYAASGTGALVISNCVFAGSNPQGGCINLAGAANQSDVRLVTDCKFLFNKVSYGTLGVTCPSKGVSIVRNCLFSGALREATYGMALIAATGGDGAGERYVENCVFTRNLSIAPTGSPMIGTGLAQYRGCVITNNYSSSTGDGGAALFELSRVRYSSTGSMTGCLVADNYSEFRPLADSVALMVNLSGSAQDNNAGLIKDTLFRGNRLFADAVNVASGYSFAAAVAGNTSVAKSVCATVVGSTFDSNSVTVENLAEGALSLKCRGLLALGSASKSIQYGMANCTFTGPHEDEVYEIAQYKSQNESMNVVNCIFTDDDPNAISTPFYSDSPEKLNVYNCSVKNLYPVYRPQDYGAFSSVSYDPIPLEEVAFGVGDASVYRPAARVPSIRDTCDVATNCQVNSSYGSPDRPLTFAFRLPGGEWQPLTPKAQGVTSNEKSPLDDALGASRSFGSYTLGALQPLSSLAENGVTLTLRTDPPLSGSFSSPANQAVAAGSSITPVSVLSSIEFSGWYDGDTLCSADNPLEIASLESDKVLTARLETEKIEVAFNLGAHGAFNTNGARTMVFKLPAGTEFPAVPPYTVEEDWFDAGWPEFPSVVPGASVSYSAKIIPKSKRVFYVAPSAAGSGDGSSPENAMADFAAAYADAGLYRGEVRLASGVYTVPVPIAARSNVEVVGPEDGYAVLTGDVNGDDFWKTNGVAALAGPSVWSGATFNYPEPALPEYYWQPAGAVSDNTPNAFTVESGLTATNSTFRNLVFTGFAQSAFFADAGSDISGLEFANCRFLANGASKPASVAAVTILSAGKAAVRDSEFVGNFGCIKVVYRDVCATTDVERCTFSFNTAACITKSYQSILPGKEAIFNLRDSSFTRNYSDGAVMLDISSVRNHGPSQISGCRVSDNYGILISAAGANTGDLWPNINLEILSTEFTDNRRAPVSSGASSSLLIYGTNGRYYPVLFRDCYIAGNICTNTGSGIAALSFVSSYNRYTYINCTFERNRVISTSEGGRSALICGNNPYVGVLVGSTLMADNEVSALLPENAADIMLASSDWINAGAVIAGCVIDETKNGQLPVRAIHPSATIHVFNSAIRGGIDASSGGALTTRDLYSGDPMVASSARQGPGGLRARGLSALSPCRYLGVPFWRAANDCYYYRLPGDNDFRQMGASLGRHPDDSEAAALGLNRDGPYLPDAWGRPRRTGRIAPGPLNPPPSGLSVFIY